MPVAPPPLPPTTDILIVENTRDPLYSERLRVLSAYREDTSIAYLPETLFIHFKRFEYVSPEKMKKINTRVNFPEILDLDKYVDGSKGRSTTQYRLKGAVHHSGGFNFGHYYCYNMVINSRDKPEWIKFNDNIVSRVEDQVEGRVPSEILTSDKEAVPYILAYQKIDRPVKKYEPLDETVSDSEEESRSGEGESGSGESGSDESDGICVEEYIINGLVFNVATDSENLLDVYVQRDPDDVGDNEHIGNLKDHLEIDTRSLASMDYDEKRELINVYLIEGLKDMLSKNIIPDDIVPIITESL